MKRAETEDEDGSGSKGEKQQADYEVSKLPGAKKGESNQGWEEWGVREGQVIIHLICGEQRGAAERWQIGAEERGGVRTMEQEPGRHY